MTYPSKVVPIIKCTCTVSLITSEIFQLTHRYRYQFVGKVMTDIKEMIQQCATLGFPRELKSAFSISIAFCLDVLIRNENITPEECKTKNRLK